VEDTSKVDREEHVSHKSRTPQVACLELSKQNLTRKGFSGEVAERIMHSQRESTRNQYQNRWLGFVSWCMERGQNPLKASIPLIADFLTFLFVGKREHQVLSKGTGQLLQMP